VQHTFYFFSTCLDPSKYVNAEPIALSAQDRAPEDSLRETAMVAKLLEDDNAESSRNAQNVNDNDAVDHMFDSRSPKQLSDFRAFADGVYAVKSELGSVDGDTPSNGEYRKVNRVSFQFLFILEASDETGMQSRKVLLREAPGMMFPETSKSWACF
jgi:hypothetical protein